MNPKLQEDIVAPAKQYVAPFILLAHQTKETTKMALDKEKISFTRLLNSERLLRTHLINILTTKEST